VSALDYYDFKIFNYVSFGKDYFNDFLILVGLFLMLLEQHQS